MLMKDQRGIKLLTRSVFGLKHDDDDDDDDDGVDDSEEEEDEDNERTIETRLLRQEPMVHLTTHCPNLTDIVIPEVYLIKNVHCLAFEIAQRLCPKLISVKIHSAFKLSSSRLTGWILEAVPEQQVQRFHCLA
ncbi:hypothetical protein BG015_000269 [Linnemannia schmuckeri]|uniref:Uncharacterized protein n=1 Tax=Linnemannia schmuckeri TaxID=64567 RepID=A0A9P5S486_9FUNG|nr:hypothetical protein BG015_000269 [Linnemannia schmuckeri]